MRLVVYIVGVIAMTTVVGCEMAGKMSDDRYFPKEPAFSIKPEPVSASSGLDFNAVYYLANNRIPGLPPYGGGNYYRFWPNGRVLVRMTRTEEPPSTADADALWRAHLGYYRVRGNLVDMEFYVHDSGKGWTYERVNGFIDEAGNLERTSTSVGDRVRPYRLVFVKEHLQGMKRAPDW